MFTSTRTRREFLASLTGLAIVPTVAASAVARGDPPPRRKSSRSGRHCVFVAEVPSAAAKFVEPSDLCVIMGPMRLFDRGHTLKIATRIRDKFNRQQLAGGCPIKQWAVVIYRGEEVTT